MKEKETEYKIESPLGVKYTVPESKAVAMVNKIGCKWDGAEPKQTKPEINEPTEEIKEEPKKRTRRTKAEIEADKK